MSESKKEDSECQPIEIEEDRLFWVSAAKTPKSSSKKGLYFCIDNVLTYEAFFQDFGPHNLANTHKFACEVQKILQKQKKKIYHYTTLNEENRTNAAYLMGAFLIICRGKTAEEAWNYFKDVKPPFKPYRDAIAGPCSYECTILDCLRGLKYAMDLGWYNPKTFNMKEYEFYEKVENGDLNWIIPGKFIAFSSPSAEGYDEEGYRTFTPEDYSPIFKKLGVGMVIRLNKPQYDRKLFEKNGIKHYDLYFTDGSTPDEDIINKFFKLVENEKSAIAVHCKAGLGRTGTLIALYAMKHFRFPARAFIGYIRICRPGSILGPQQAFLVNEQNKYFELGEKYRKEKGMTDELCLKLDKLKLDDDKVAYSKNDLEIQNKGDKGQGEGLTGQKRIKQNEQKNKK